jgi:Cof subfamily protein (haloacid dehalogenase superfamily)
MIRLVFIDVDGTLYGRQGVPPCAWEAVARAQARGLRLAICTGRPGRGFALEYAERLDPEGLHIFESGAVVLHPRQGPKRLIDLPEDQVQALVRLAREEGAPLEVYTADGGYWIETGSSLPDLELHQAMLGVKAEETDLLSLRQVVRLQFVVHEELWSRLRTLMPRELNLHEATSPAMPGIVFASLTAPGVSKLAAARWVLEAWGWSLEEAAMVGDGENDLELIEAVELGIAMGNAPEDVRRRAKRVVARVEACGLAEALDQIV